MLLVLASLASPIRASNVNMRYNTIAITITTPIAATKSCVKIWLAASTAVAFSTLFRPARLVNANPEVNVVWAVNAEMGQGAIQAIDQMNMTGNISVFDFDASSDDLDAIEAGTLTGSVAQYPNKQAESAIQACLDVLDGKTLEEHTETPSLLVTADNIEDYKEEMGIE